MASKTGSSLNKNRKSSYSSRSSGGKYSSGNYSGKTSGVKYTSGKNTSAAKYTAGKNTSGVKYTSGKNTSGGKYTSGKNTSGGKYSSGKNYTGKYSSQNQYDSEKSTYTTGLENQGSRKSTADGYPRLSYIDETSPGKTASKASGKTSGKYTASPSGKKSAASSGKSGSANAQKTSVSAPGKQRTGKTAVRTGRTGSSGKSPRRPASSDNYMILRLLILVVLVIVVFEGKLIFTMFSQRTGNNIVTASSSDPLEIETESIPSEDTSAYAHTVNSVPEASSAENTGGGSGVAGLAGLSAVDNTGSDSSVSTGSVNDDGTVSEQLTSGAVISYIEPPVDDSYFRDAVFIGDSRMEGFRNTSGITQGTFLTSVGMSLSDISNTKVSSPDGEITVYQGLSGRQYGKIYLMLGTNDLGYYPWEAFKDNAEEVLEQFHELQPNAMIYVCGVIYVEGQKISTDYVNNDNVRKVNGYLLEACEDLSYCYYLNLNEIFSNGYGALIDGATADGVHLQPQYSSMMLDYLKSHYIPVSEEAKPQT